MARKKIRECTAKLLLKKHHKGIPDSFRPIQIDKTTDWKKLIVENPWLTDARLVLKPDMLFGQRGKHDLVALNVNVAAAEEFVKERLGKVITVGESQATDAVSHFIMEIFVPHTQEFYLSIQSFRDYTRIQMSSEGGVEIESNWEKIKTIDVPVGELPVKPKSGEMVDFGEDADAMWEFLRESFRVFEDLDFSMMEFNPLCSITENDQHLVIPLDMRGELDDQAAFKNTHKWVGVESFPPVFGHQNCPEEDLVTKLDSQTGASLKLSIINPAGRMWLLVAGGGASVIYTDTVCDLGYGETLGNYGEYSGNPTDDDTFQYTSAVLSVATRLDESCPHKGRCLLIGGGVANFTDIKATFKGIIRALLAFSKPLQDAGFHIFVRRGGPNYEAALKMMKEIEVALGVPIQIFGPDVHMTRIVHLASESLKAYDERPTE